MEQATTRRPRRTQKEITDLLSEFEKGNLSVMEFCKQHNFSRATFHKWCSRYGSTYKSESAFSQLHIGSTNQLLSASLFAEVDGIKIYQPVSAAYLKELLR